MASWRKSPPALIAFFDEVLPEDSRVERRKMFGYPCAFTGGNMFTGLHQESMIVRLSEPDRERLLQEKGASTFEPMPGRVMKEYVALPPAMATSDAKAWVSRSLDYAASLPAKPASKRRRAAPAKKSRAKKKA